jgi:hypothetical protein
MIQYLFAIYDSKVDAYMPVLQMRTTAEALRAFTTAVNDGKSVFSQYPEDYSLVKVGVFDDIDGTITAIEKPEVIQRAIHLAKCGEANA